MSSARGDPTRLRDLDALSRDAADAARRRDPRVPDRRGVQDRRAPRPEPRRRRADHGDPPGLRLAARRDRVRHRAPELRAQAAHRAARTSRGCAEAAASPATRSARESVHDIVESSHASSSLSLGGRDLARVRDDRPERPLRGRRGRRRSAHRRHDLGGAQQHQRRQQPPPGHRRQRQRPLVRPDDRRHGALSQHGAHAPRVPRPAPQERRGSSATSGPRGRAIYRGARGAHARLPGALQQQRGALLEPRHQVHRAGRRPRPARARGRAASRPRTTARRCIVHVDHRRRATATSRPSHDVADQFHAVGQIDPETGEPIEHAEPAVLDLGVRRRDGRAGAIGIRRSSASPRAMLRPTGLYKMAEKYPERVFDVGIAEQHAVTSPPRASPSAACIPVVASTRPSSTAHSTRC